MSVEDFLVIDFGGGCSFCSSCCCCDRGKTKSTPSPFDLDWNGLGLEFDKNKFLCDCAKPSVVSQINLLLTEYSRTF